MSTCNHDRKVYSGEYFACYPPKSGEYFACYPPKWHWACEDCGEVGATAPLRDAPATPDWRRFCDAMAKRDPRGAAVLRDTYARAEERRKAGDGMGSFRMIQKGVTVTINDVALPMAERRDLRARTGEAMSMSDEERMALDREIHGISFAVEREDGTLARVDPSDVQRDASWRWMLRGRLDTIAIDLRVAE